LNADGIRALSARGHIVGSHSHNHPLAMSSLSRVDLQREWDESAEVIAGVLGVRPTVASIPGGAYSVAVAKAAGRAGIRTLFTSEPTARPWTVSGVTCYGRYTLWRGMSPETALQFVQGHGTMRVRQQIAWNAKKILKWTFGSAYLELRRRLLANEASVNAARGTGAPPAR
jgi:peptidoglycan/xylan/chitin deacetylase (PgdA/CDA1 family)